MDKPVRISMEKVLYPPSYIPIPESACELTAPLRCPDCAGVIKLETKSVAAAGVLFCPYCLSGLRVPGVRGTDAPNRVRAVASRNGIVVIA